MTSSKHFRLTGMLIAAVALTLVPAILHGRYTNRWGPPAGLSLAGEKVSLCPNQIGLWRKVDEWEFLDQVIRELALTGYVRRSYVHEHSGERVELMLLVGAAGALSRHPPEICYEVSANDRLGSPLEVQLRANDQSNHSFRILRYRRPGPVGEPFTVCYGFTTEGTWDCPSHPRIKFGACPVLYKMQVLCDGTSSEGESIPPATSKFLAEFLPVLRDGVIHN